jgi:hypothetical protein
MYSVEHNHVFTALAATSIGRYDHHQANGIQNLKEWLHVVHKMSTLYGIPFTLMSIFIREREGEMDG